MMRLRWQALERSGPAVQVQEAFYPPGFAFPLHDHDFAELFAVLDGDARHRGTDARELPAPRRSLGCVPPALRHALAAPKRCACTLLNIAFPVTMLEQVLDRYPHLERFWRAAWPPFQTRLAAEDLHALQDWARRLAEPGAGELELHAFLLDLAARLVRPQRETAGSAPPTWLAEAIDAATDPEGFAQGVAAIARASGRSGAHVNRLIRKHYGMTANQLLNRRRMQHAARLLRHSELPIAAIIADCGFAAPAQFYRRFHQQFAIAPAAYRAGGGRAAL